MNLEDGFFDIITKASKGKNILLENIPKNPKQKEIKTIASNLNLSEKKLQTIVNGWKPTKKEHPNVINIQHPFYEGVVNSYLLIKEDQAIAIDTGLTEKDMTQIIEEKGLHLLAVLITHEHPDHIAGLEKLKEVYGCEVIKAQEDTIKKIEKFEIKMLKTPGHTQTHNCYVWKNYCFVGDLLFAGSIGGSNDVPFKTHIESIEKKIMTLNEKTVIFPGHGPITSVKEEKENNPFLS